MAAPDGNPAQSAEFGGNVAQSAHAVCFVMLLSQVNPRQERARRVAAG
jgi:hypothetical protein